MKFLFLSRFILFAQYYFMKYSTKKIWIYETEFQFHYLLQSWQWAWRKFMQTLYGEITQRFLLIQYFEFDLKIIYPKQIFVHHQDFFLYTDTMNISIIYYHLHKTKNIHSLLGWSIEQLQRIWIQDPISKCLFIGQKTLLSLDRMNIIYIIAAGVYHVHDYRLQSLDLDCLKEVKPPFLFCMRSGKNCFSTNHFPFFYLYWRNFLSSTH